ncbi:2-keto-4-pentenoate hydratase [Azospirillum sp. sgz301742]
MTGTIDEARVSAAAERLLTARRTRAWLAALPDDARPRSEAEADAVQDAVARRSGPQVAWKVGARTPVGEPFRAPLNAATVWPGASVLPADAVQFIGLEAEIAYRFDRDLPPRDLPYAADEVYAAIGSIHPAIEIVDTRFTAFGGTDALSHRADQMNHGALIVGAGRRDWRAFTPVTQPVRLEIDGAVASEGIGGNTAGDPLRLLVWLANVGTRTLGGIAAGQIVTTGSCTGTIFAKPGVAATASFPGLGAVSVTVEGG